MRVVWVALLLAAGLAGCAQDGGPGVEPESLQETKATADTGVIRGVVVDQTITPVEGATVRAQPGDLSSETDADGAFVFQDLEPGTYFLTARAPFHSEVQTSTEVVAGVDRPPIVRIALQSVPVPDPFIEAFRANAHMTFSGWVQGVGGVVTTNFLGDGTWGASHDMAGNVSWVQTEVVWDPAQPLAESFRLYSELEVTDGEELSDGVETGPSPLLYAHEEEAMTSDAPVTVDLDIFADADAYPVGLFVDQQAELFTHAFHFFVPSDGWRFTSDGDHPVPEEPDG